MREIKFRAKTATTNRWVYGHYAFKEGYHVIYEGGEPFVIVGSTLGQYTSLKDQKGVEIYEGDIVNLCWSDEVGESHWGKVAIKNPFEYTPEEARYFIYSDELEIIGNIYENQELLECEAE